MRTLLAGAVPWFAALVVGATAAAQDNSEKRNPDQPQTIRGVIAGVTVEGELSVDYRTRRAVEAEMTLLSVVGAPVGAEERHEGNDADQTHRHRHHRNLYVLVLSPRTTVHDAAHEGAKDEKGQPSNKDALEIGDRVEVSFTPREEDKSATATDGNRRAKHGRHRTYFGDAMSIKILAEPSHDAQASEKSTESKPNDENEKK